MKAILITNQLYPDAASGCSALPAMSGGREGASDSGLAPLIDRPFLQHALESVIEAGCTQVTIVCARQRDVVQRALGAGRQWGIDLRYCSTEPGRNTWSVIKEMDLQSGDRLLIARADLLPDLSNHNLRARDRAVFCWGNPDLHWTGWALLRGADIHLIANASDPIAFCPRALPSREIKVVERPLSSGTFSDLIESHRRVMLNQHSGLLLTGREQEPGIRIGRNAKVHPSVKLISPVFIGENSRVKAGAQIGPFAAIGKDCLIDKETLIVDSVVCQGTYIGEGLDIRNMYVDGGRLIRVDLNTVIGNIDDVFFSSVYRAGMLFRAAGS